MAQQVTKRYRLKKDIQSPAQFCPAGTISVFENGFYQFRYTEGSGVFGIGACIADPSIFPDWFEEVKDTPFEVNTLRLIKQERKDVGGICYELWCNGEIPVNKRNEISRKIEDIVNGVDEKDKCLFDADKINARLRELEIEKLEREAFEAARYRITGYPCAEGMKPIDGGFCYKTYEDYKNSKK